MIIRSVDVLRNSMRTSSLSYVAMAYKLYCHITLCLVFLLVFPLVFLLVFPLVFPLVFLLVFPLVFLLAFPLAFSLVHQYGPLLLAL